MSDIIYCLAEIEGKPFYVGRTNDYDRRLYEHRYGAKTGTEAKYQYIRNLWKNNSNFEMIIIDSNPGERYEKYYHYELGCQFDLTNQKMGDDHRVEKIVTRTMHEKGQKFSSPIEFLTALDLEIEREIKEEKARKQAARITKRIRSNSNDTERTLFAGDSLKNAFKSDALREIEKRRTKEQEYMLQKKTREWHNICRNYEYEIQHNETRKSE